MIEVKNLWFSYEDNEILKNISLKIMEGSFNFIAGANGSGKTTLAKHFNGLLIPDRGDILVDGLNTKKDSFEIRKKVGFVFQNPEDQLVHSIVEEDVAFGLENLKVLNKEMKMIVKNILKKLNILHLAECNVNFLSAGQKQLVALAGVLAMNPNYIVLDEPTTLLDSKNKKNILGIIEWLNKKEGKTIIFITNILEDIKTGDRIIFLKNGSIIFDGIKNRLKKSDIKEAGLYD